ncbi:MAG: glycosyl hydrolase [Candidatus Sumerlaeaceae bacterium]|nr:glycosyl hydrolase [Candidatus Sumerlaeaceae bacterium]
MLRHMRVLAFILFAGLWAGSVSGADQTSRPLLLGVNVVWGDGGGTSNFDRNGRARRLLDWMTSAGVTNTRLGVGWDLSDSGKGNYDWGDFDPLVRLVRARGIEVVACVAGTPEYARDPDPRVRMLFEREKQLHLLSVTPPDPAYLDDFERWSEALVARYRNLVKRWELWNEQDGMGMPLWDLDTSGVPVRIRWGGNPNRYAEMLKRFHRAAKRADPDCIVIVGGLQVPETRFIEGLYEAGGGPCFDAVGLHPYTEKDRINIWWIDQMREVLVRRGDGHKPFYITEYGWHATSPETQALQARLLQESMQAMLERPFIEQASYHTLNDWRTDEQRPESLMAMGLLTRDLKPKAAYEIFRSLSRDLSRY